MMKFHFFRSTFLAISAILFLGACAGEPDTTDTDAGPDAGAGHDVDSQDATGGDDPDAPGETDPVHPPELIEPGEDGLVLRGTVLTADEVLQRGEVVVEHSYIACVETDCSWLTDDGDYAVVETDGVISPGLVDAHNHLPYNFLPPWFPNPDTTFNNRYEWADKAAYRDHIAPYADNRMSGTHYCPAAKWGELRSLLHATTTIQGQSFRQRCVDWAVRNADHYHGLKHNHLRTTIASALDINEEQAQNYIDSFEADSDPTTRLAIHMGEGVHGDGVEHEFDAFAGRGEHTRHPGVSLLEHGTALLIHGVTLTPAQVEEIYLTDSQFVWSPSSNFHLYGQDITAPIELILEWDITTALGPDWTISGAFDMLEEMRIAYDYGQRNDIEALTPKRIWEMATIGGADAVGLADYIGRLEPGYHADIAIFGRNGDDPYRAVLDSRAEDLELVMIDGDVYFGDADLEGIARNEHCESFFTCGVDKFVCAVDFPTAGDRRDETVNDIRHQLVSILDGREDAPDEEQYDRGDELLDLVICE